MNIGYFTVFLIALTALATPSRAHHSFPAHYYAERSVTIEGTMVEFLYRNPHSFIYLEVENEAGDKELWAAEWGNTLRMTNQGYAPDSFNEGDHLIISGNPSRDAERRVRLVTLERPADNLKATRDGPRPSN